MPPQKALPTLKKPASAVRMRPKAKEPAAAALPAAGPSAATAAPGPWAVSYTHLRAHETSAHL
eukprot:5987791-Alexandrium_andersonii.AAC.1